jgi:hypothetical protein
MRTFYGVSQNPKGAPSQKPLRHSQFLEHAAPSPSPGAGAQPDPVHSSHILGSQHS